MSQEKYPMTTKGAEALKAELQNLKTVERPAVIEAIAEARAHGDLKENAEYHAAREQQSFIEGRIKEIEAKLASAVVVDITRISPSDKVIFASTITLLNLENDQRVSYQIVGVDEADIKQGKISVSSPIARAAIGKEEGDVIEVSTPSGVIEYEIEEVAYR